MEGLECRTLLSGNTLATAVPLTFTTNPVAAQGILNHDANFYAFQVTDDNGRVTAQDHANGFRTRLSLLSADGQVLMQSDGQSASNPDPLVDVHVSGSSAGTTYYLEVQALGNGTGNYTLSANYTSSTAPGQTLDVGRDPHGVATADFDGDGHLDLAVTGYYSNDVTVYLGTGDGTFTNPQSYDIGDNTHPIAVVAGDFNGGGKLDLAVGNANGTISILTGNGDGTFGTAVRYQAGTSVAALATADFNGDGKLDLAIADQGSNSVVVFLNKGDGTFAPPLRVPVGVNPDAIIAGDFNGDGRVDLVTANSGSNNVSVLLGNGDGTFAPQRTVDVGQGPHALVAGDFNGGGKLDLATANSDSNDVSVLLGNGNGTFTPKARLAAGRGPTAIVAADFNGDGRTDLAVANLKDATISTYLGLGNGAFAAQQQIPVKESPSSLVAADFNHDGALDLVITHLTIDAAEVLLGRGDGTFFANPRQSPGAAPNNAVVSDFDRDGTLDVATVDSGTQNVTILLGQGDGTFRFGGEFPTGGHSWAIASGDFSGDGILDLVTANFGSGTVSVLLGRGDGTFGPPAVFAVGPGCTGVGVGDFNGDGHLDIAAANSDSDTVSILFGDGTGKFAAPVNYRVGVGPDWLVAGDFNHDGSLDLAVANSLSNDVSFLLNRGDGTFAPEVRLPAGQTPFGISAADFNGDGTLDLVTANRGSNDVSVFLGDGKGGFAPAITSPTGVGPYEVLVGDFNHDGTPDLVTMNVISSSMTVLLGRGDGTFQQSAQIQGGETLGGAVGDFNGDGKLDIAADNRASSDVSLFLGNGDGTFQAPMMTPIAHGPVAIAAADFNGAGQLDLVTANPTAGTVEVSLGNGDGTFQIPTAIPLEGEPIAVVTGDFNHDGRPDIAVANYLTNTVSILLGLGDGTFQPSLSYAVGRHPDALIVGDFNGDGILDLAVANFGSSTVSILLGRGDGTFTVGQQISVGKGPVSLALGDVNGDGKTDLVVASSLARSISILAGSGNGTFRLIDTVALGTVPSAVVTGDFNADGKVDIAATSQASNTVSVLLGKGDGTFQAPVKYTVGTAPVALATGDFNGDGNLDLAVANNSSNDVTFLLGRGDGTFQAQAPVAVGLYPSALLARDFTNDGRLDFATVNGLGQTLSIRLGLGNATFTDPDKGGHPIHSTPLVGDLNGNGLADVAILAGNGQILVRFGDPKTPGTFQPPIVLNPNPADNVRDLTLVTINGKQALAAIGARDNTIWLYSYAGNSRFVRTRGPALPAGLPVRIVAGDLNGDGRQDLVVALSGSGSGLVDVYLQQADGTFGKASYERQVGVSPSDLALVNLAGGPRPDIVVTDQFSGEISVLQNTTSAPFSTRLSFRADTRLAGVTQVGTAPAVQSREAPISLAFGAFSGGATPDVVVLNGGSDRFDLLAGDGHGGVFNPTTSLTYRTGTVASALVAGDFNGDGTPDLAILDRGSNQVLIYLGDGKGSFVPQYATGTDGQPFGLSAGNAPNGLAVADVNHDGRLDLLVGNASGDVLVLLGNGNGSFKPYQRVDRHVALAKVAVNGRSGFVFADKARDRVVVDYGRSGQDFQQGRQDGVLDPNAVKVADLNGDGIPDLIVANGGSNEVIVYLGLGNGQFGPARHFFTGTNPTAVTVSDLRGDGILDLVVANRGSNDVSILFGQGRGDSWTLTQGPRLHAGLGPSATVVQDIDGDGIPDILVSNSASNNVYVLPGVGQGFFNDTSPTIFPTGQDPEQLLVGHFSNRANLDLVTLNAGSNDLSYFANFGPGRSIASGGLEPVAAVEGDFIHNGLSDLIVAHRGDNLVTLLLASVDGPRIAATLSAGNQTNLSDLALGAVHGNAVDCYVSREGDETITPLTFLMGPPSVPHNDLLQPNSPEQQIVEVSTLPDLPLGLVVTLLLGPAGEPSSETSGVAGAGAVWGTLLGQANFIASESPSSGSEADAELANEAQDVTNPSTANDAPVTLERSINLNAFITGSTATAPGQPLKKAQELILKSLLPAPELFNFSDLPAARGREGVAPVQTHDAGAAQRHKERSPQWTKPGPVELGESVGTEQSALPGKDNPLGSVEPVGDEPSPAWHLRPSADEVVSQESITSQIWGATVFLAQALLVPDTCRKRRHDKEPDSER